MLDDESQPQLHVQEEEIVRNSIKDEYCIISHIFQQYMVYQKHKQCASLCLIKKN